MQAISSAPGSHARGFFVALSEIVFSGGGKHTIVVAAKHPFDTVEWMLIRTPKRLRFHAP